jgi:quinoprotein glucose dehydrogenase
MRQQRNWRRSGCSDPCLRHRSWKAAMARRPPYSYPGQAGAPISRAPISTRKLACSMCPSHTRPYAMSLVPPDAPDSDWPYVIRVQRNIGPMGLPLTKPPYRRITAIDLNTGEQVWQIPFGRGPVNHPLLAHLNLPDLGSVFTDVSSEGGLLVTRSLVISHLAQKDEIDPDADGSILVAFDKSTGGKGRRSAR